MGMKILFLELILNIVAVSSNEKDTNGVFFLAATNDALEGASSSEVVIDKTFFNCGRQENCTLVVKNLETGAYTRHNKEISDIPRDLRRFTVWEKNPGGRENSEEDREFENCKVAMNSGLTTNVTISIPRGNGESFKAVCDMTSDGGGWTLVQRRVHGNVSFERGWDEYVRGFGELDGDFWLGLDAIHQLTKDGFITLRFDLQNIKHSSGFASYNGCKVDGPSSNYSLLLGNYHGNIGDGMADVNMTGFSTIDRDNDYHYENCASIFKGAWWYNKCSLSRLNSRFPTTAAVESKYDLESRSDIMKWQTWVNSTTIIRSEIKIR